MNASWPEEHEWDVPMIHLSLREQKNDHLSMNTDWLSSIAYILVFIMLQELEMF